jgi:hypothetical protein
LGFSVDIRIINLKIAKKTGAGPSLRSYPFPERREKAKRKRRKTAESISPTPQLGHLRKREAKMEKLESEVKWEESFEKGLERSRAEGKPILLDFFKDG